MLPVITEHYEGLDWHLQEALGTKQWDRGDWAVLREAYRKVGPTYAHDLLSDGEKRCALWLSCEESKEDHEIQACYCLSKWQWNRMRKVLFAALFADEEVYSWKKVRARMKTDREGVKALLMDTRVVQFLAPGRPARGTQAPRVTLPPLQQMGPGFVISDRPVGLVTVTTTTKVGGKEVTEEQFLLSENVADLEFLGDSGRLIDPQEYEELLANEQLHKKVRVPKSALVACTYCEDEASILDSSSSSSALVPSRTISTLSDISAGSQQGAIKAGLAEQQDKGFKKTAKLDAKIAKAVQHDAALIARRGELQVLRHQLLVLAAAGDSWKSLGKNKLRPMYKALLEVDHVNTKTSASAMVLHGEST
ncbi:hypothetical protein B484DRAFT_436875, partial [Ochromonadaceae sp. CCMP2298]